MKSLVSVVLPTCGKNDYFIACLKSVSLQTYLPIEVILIDNSMDSSVSCKARRIFPEACIYVSNSNLYYSGGMNKGIELSRGEYILCLNDDALLDIKFIENAMQAFSFDSRIGMVSGKILRMDQKTIDSTGLFLTFCRTAQERGYGELDKGKYEKKEYIFGVSGVAALYRKDMLDEIKEGKHWFDSCFHMFYEDMDVSWRANRYGWKAYYMPTALVYHIRGGTARSNFCSRKIFARDYLNDDLYGDLIKNRYLMILKNETVWGLFLHIVPIFLYDLIVFFYMFCFRPGVLRGLWKNKKYFRMAWEKRFRCSP